MRILHVDLDHVDAAAAARGRSDVIERPSGRCKFMQLPDVHADNGDNIVVTFYIKDGTSTTDATCETFYSTDRSSWIVQGKRRGSTVAAQLVGLADDETFCEMSSATMDAFVRRYVRERYGVELG